MIEDMAQPHRRHCDALAAQLYSPRELTEGERWTAEALLALRRRRYSAIAWRHFIGASLARASDTRSAHPELARQAQIWGIIGALGWLATCQASTAAKISPSWRGGLLWWASVYKMLNWHLGMVEGGDGEPRKRLSIADAMTLSRFWLVPLLPALRGRRYGFPVLIAAGGLTDWLDGVLARQSGRTRLGRDLDTTADLAFLGTAAVVAANAGRVPALGAYLLLGRYVGGTLLALGATFGRARRPAIRARPFGGALRVCGLALAVAGAERTGLAILASGCLTPPRATAKSLSLI